MQVETPSRRCPFANEAGDDRDESAAGDEVLLIVENDLAFAKVLLEAARAQGFKGLVAGTGAGALTMAREFHPSVITLDIVLPDMEGWRMLDRLKKDLVDAPHPDLRRLDRRCARARAAGSARSASWPSRSSPRTWWMRRSRSC